MPSEVAILPLRGLVVYPQTALPLTIGQPRSIKLIDDIAVSNRLVGLVTSQNPDLENPGPEDLFKIGTLGMIHRLFRAPDGTIRVLIQGLARISIGEYTRVDPYLKAQISPNPEVIESGLEIEALARNTRSQFEKIADLIPSLPRELVSSVLSIKEPLQTVYNIANLQRMELSDAQEILETNSVSEKFHKLFAILTRETEVLELGQKIQNEARSEIEGIQREYYLREQMKAIQKELGEADEQTVEADNFRKKMQRRNSPAKHLRLPIEKSTGFPNFLQQLPSTASSALTWTGWWNSPGKSRRMTILISVTRGQCSRKITTAWKT